MWANILTKPLHGAKLHETRAHLMNYINDYHEHYPKETITGEMHTLMEHCPPAIPLQGCVGTSKISKNMSVIRQISEKHVAMNK